MKKDIYKDMEENSTPLSTWYIYKEIKFHEIE